MHLSSSFLYVFFFILIFSATWPHLDKYILLFLWLCIVTVKLSESESDNIVPESAIHTPGPLFD